MIASHTISNQCIECGGMLLQSHHELTCRHCGLVNNDLQLEGFDRTDMKRIQRLGKHGYRRRQSLQQRFPNLRGYFAKGFQKIDFGSIAKIEAYFETILLLSSAEKIYLRNQIKKIVKKQSVQNRVQLWVCLLIILKVEAHQLTLSELIDIVRPYWSEKQVKFSKSHFVKWMCRFNLSINQNYMIWWQKYLFQEAFLIVSDRATFEEFTQKAKEIGKMVHSCKVGSRPITRTYLILVLTMQTFYPKSLEGLLRQLHYRRFLKTNTVHAYRKLCKKQPQWRDIK